MVLPAFSLYRSARSIARLARPRDAPSLAPAGGGAVRRAARPPGGEAQTRPWRGGGPRPGAGRPYVGRGPGTRDLHGECRSHPPPYGLGRPARSSRPRPGLELVEGIRPVQGRYTPRTAAAELGGPEEPPACRASRLRAAPPRARARPGARPGARLGPGPTLARVPRRSQACPNPLGQSGNGQRGPTWANVGRLPWPTRPPANQASGRRDFRVGRPPGGETSGRRDLRVGRPPGGEPGEAGTAQGNGAADDGEAPGARPGSDGRDQHFDFGAFGPGPCPGPARPRAGARWRAAGAWHRGLGWAEAGGP